MDFQALAEARSRTIAFTIYIFLIEKGKISQSLQLLSQWILRYNSYWQAVQGRVFIFEN